MMRLLVFLGCLVEHQCGDSDGETCHYKFLVEAHLARADVCSHSVGAVLEVVGMKSMRRSRLFYNTVRTAVAFSSARVKDVTRHPRPQLQKKAVQHGPSEVSGTAVLLLCCVV